MPDHPDLENSTDDFTAPDRTVPHRPDAGPMDPAELDAVLEKIREALIRDSGGTYEPLPRTPYQREPNEDGLIVVDGPGTLEWFPGGPPVPSSPSSFELE